MILIGIVLLVAAGVASFVSLIWLVSVFVNVVLSVYCQPFIEPLFQKRNMIQLDLKKAKNDASKPEKVTSLETLSDAAEDELNLMKTRFSFHKSEIKNCFIRSVGWGVLAAVLTLFGIAMISGSSMNAGQQAAQQATNTAQSTIQSDSLNINSDNISKYVGIYVAKGSWVGPAIYAGQSKEDRMTDASIILREDGTCQYPIMYEGLRYNGTYTIENNTLIIDGESGKDFDGNMNHSTMTTEIFDDGIMWSNVYFEKQ